MWSEEKSLELIELYKNQSVLWDPKEPTYFKKPLKNYAWREIADSLGIEAEECKNKMISVLASYRREKAKVKKHLGTGKGSQEIYHSTWFAYEALAFLGDRDTPRKRLNSIAVDIDVVSNSVSTNDENDSVKESDMPRESISHSQPPKKKRSYTEPSENIKRNEMLAEALGILKATTSQPAPNVSLDNENLHFINIIGSKMMKYPPNVRNAVERAITDVLFKADEGYYNFYPNQYAQQLQQWPSNYTTCTTAQMPAPPVRVEIPAISPYGTSSQPSPAYSQLSLESLDILDLV